MLDEQKNKYPMFDNMSEDQEQMLANYYSRSLRAESLLSQMNNKFGENTTEGDSEHIFDSSKDEEISEL